MLKDIPYSVLKQDKRAYEIMLLRDQYANTFSNIAKDYEISVVRVRQIYNRLKIAQIRLYINHISVVLEHNSISKIGEVYSAAYECYQEWPYACAYLEKKYKDILTAYRAGEPGMPAQVIESMPPFTPELSEHTIARVIEMRENERESFVLIAKELHITRAKAKHTYKMFYHKKVLAFVKTLQEKASSNQERRKIWDDCFKGNKSSKELFDMLTKKQNQAE